MFVADRPPTPGDGPRVAVLIPCYNEELSIARVVRDFRAVLPQAGIYVYDNNSRDESVRRAVEAGAIVRSEPLQGKGYVVRRMFADVEADIYVMVDGDDTYEASAAAQMIDRMTQDGLDIVNGRRVGTKETRYRAGHQFGNWFLSTVVALIFGPRMVDMLSGFKVMSRRFVKSFPCLATGFEIETELAIHALELVMPIGEVSVGYRDRQPGSGSKLHTLRDGLRISWTILKLLRAERPLIFFGAIFAALALVSSILGWEVYTEWLRTGLVLRIPTAILTTGIMLLAFLSAACGIILETVTLGRRENKRMVYLSIPAPARESASNVEVRLRSPNAR